MKNKINSNIVEGLIFGGSGLWLLSYSITSFNKAFNKDWTQSPYLFPFIIAIALIGLSIGVIIDGVLKSLKNGTGETKPLEWSKIRKVLVILLLCATYYVGLKLVRLPAVTFSFTNTFYITISNFEILTFVFLEAMLGIMGVKNKWVYAFVPLGMTLFFSIAFRSLLHVLLP